MLFFSHQCNGTGGCEKNRGEGAVGVEENMTNDDLVMYLTFHTQMVDNV